MTRRSRRLAIPVVTLAAAVASVACRRDTPPPIVRAHVAPFPASSTSRARDHYLKGGECFRAGDYECAMEHFKISYELTGDPNALFMLASSHDNAGRWHAARKLYRHYLRTNPVEHLDVKARIERLTKQISSVCTPAQKLYAGCRADGKPLYQGDDADD